MIEKIQTALSKYNGEWKEKKEIWEFKVLIAERKAFLSKKKLTYLAKMRIVENEKLVKFTEMLVDQSSGFSSGGSFDDSMTPGVGFKKESYNTLSGKGREGTIEEQSSLFGKEFSYKFDYKEIRELVEKTAQANGYKFAYQVTAIGL